MVLGIYGAGRLGKEVYELALDVMEASGGQLWEEIIFISDVEVIENVWGAQVISFEEFCSRWSPAEAVISIGLGEPDGRKQVRKRVTVAGYSLQKLIHPMTRVSRKAVIDDGCIVTYGCNVSYNTHVRCNAYLQPSCGLGHGTVLGEDSVVSAGVRIAGDVQIGRETYIGMNASVREMTKIGHNVVIGMMSAVQRDLPDEVIAAGNPARPLRNNEHQRIFGELKTS